MDRRNILKMATWSAPVVVAAAAAPLAAASDCIPDGPGVMRKEGA